MYPFHELMIFLAAFIAVFLLLWLIAYGSGPAVGRRLLARTAHWTAKFR